MKRMVHSALLAAVVVVVPAAATQGAGVAPITRGDLKPISKNLKREPKVRRQHEGPARKLIRKTIVRGHGAAAASGDTLTVQYTGYALSTGKKADASWDDGQPFGFRLGAGQVIAGWDKGLVGMKVGGRRELVIPAKLAYGKDGYPPAIGPGETLIFVVDLKSIRG